jgi:hypothetical protein
MLQCSDRSKIRVKLLRGMNCRIMSQRVICMRYPHASCRPPQCVLSDLVYSHNVFYCTSEEQALSSNVAAIALQACSVNGQSQLHLLNGTNIMGMPADQGICVHDVLVHEAT